MSAPLAVPVMPQTVLHKMFTALHDRLRLGFAEGLFAIEMMHPSPTVKELDRVLVRKPFIGLAWVSADIEPIGRQLKGKASWTALIAIQNGAGAEQRFKGDNLGIGLAGCSMVVAGLLHSWTVPYVGAVRVTSINTVHPEGWGDDSIAMTLVSFEIDFTQAVAPGGEADLADFLRMNIAWAAPGTINIPALTTNIEGS